MLTNKTPVATVAVRDLGKARKFYEGKLGLDKPVDESSETLMYDCGGVSLLLYSSAENAGTNKATTVTWMVGEQIAEVVEQLKSKGVAFENYEFPGAVKEGDVYVGGDIRTAWFTDPDGNIHAVVNG